MNCMKCGRETDGEQVFCTECLLDMEKYPVKPGTVVQLPRRVEPSSGKKAHSHRRVNLSPEEQVKLLKKRVRLLTFLLIVTLALAAALLYPALENLLDTEYFLPGQNYSTLDPGNPAEPG